MMAESGRRCVVCGVGKSYVCGLGIPRKAGANALWHLVDKWLRAFLGGMRESGGGGGFFGAAGICFSGGG